ncbi:hypothetical protein [Lactobacillus helveticus]|uniref:hypothetical protein n=1 Tax=Lactobacillus helveticus TaxID=1587 RepID=UPI0015624836|nr:hypothetical protein [Lactobacillus helveticus]NRO04938.1 hypothetical protein [Lactobacillus helveticus]NRO19413.1 hypothetical protein [Lactobacillus helveticus]NRO39462.1 hypothetical protein [Lactobacillus helveticus]NRO49263.1 hypothetical protein [Lactobacillus helveticus]NRO59176.1 hypothetical protein [Lactobacillus helveticus]
MAFERDTKIKDSIITSEKKSKEEEKAEKEKFAVNSTLPVNKNNRSDKKVYRTYYLYESQIKKLEKIAKQNGYVKKNGEANTSAFIRDWIDSI